MRNLSLPVKAKQIGFDLDVLVDGKIFKGWRLYKKDKTIFAICDGNLVMYSQNMEIGDMTSNQISILCSKYACDSSQMNVAMMFTMFVEDHGYYDNCFTQIYKSF